MNFEIQRNKDVTTVYIEDSLELKFTKELQNKLIDIIQSEDKDIELNLSGANYIDSTGTALLLKIYKIQRSKGKKIKLVEVSPKIQNVLKLSNVSDLFQI
jgi:anti-sigma B factor antagonist